MYKLPIRLFLSFFVLPCVVSRFICADLPPIIDIYQTSYQFSEVERLRNEVETLKAQLSKANENIKAQASLLEPFQKQKVPKKSLKQRLCFTKKAKVISKSSSVQNVNTLAEKDWEAASQLLKAHHYQKAAKAFQKIIKQYPLHIRRMDADAVLVQVELLRKNPKQALRYSKQFLKKYSDNARAPEVQFYTGLAYYAQKNNTMAYKVLTQLIERYPDHPMAKNACEHLTQLNLKTNLSYL